MAKADQIGLIPGEKIVIMGMSGYGKTVLIRHLIKQLDKFIVIDTPSGQYQDLGKCIPLVGSNPSDWIKHEKLIVQDSKVSQYKKFLLEILESLENRWLVIDEVSLITTPNPSEEFKRAIVWGRNRGCGVILAAQRPVLIPRVATSQANKIICFKLREAACVKYVKDNVGELFAKKVRALKRYQFCVFDVDTEVITQGSLEKDQI